jgi:glucose/arabinose dehydrogenase
MRNPKRYSKRVRLLFAALAGLAPSTLAQPWTQPYTSSTAIGDCAGLSRNLKDEFVVEPVISDTLFSEVAPYQMVKMAFYLQLGAQNTDIYVAEKGDHAHNARVLYYDGTKNSLKVIGTLQNALYGSNGSVEHGLLGIALNPKTFARDHFLYLYYSVGSGTFGSTKQGLRVSRFRLNPITQEIDFGSEKVLLFIPIGPYLHYFSGSGMHFDHAGHLYVSVGSNEALAIGPANTADFRGSILRIKPDTTNPKGYVIPAGNFGEYWAQQFDSLGRVDLAKKYRDTTKVKEEIYIKGVRNVYSFSVDASRPGMVEWSQCGPDRLRGETHSLTTKPAFGGWPFWLHANNSLLPQAVKDDFGIESGDPKISEWASFNPPTMSPSAPVNTWAGIQGVDTLPPYHLPFFSYSAPYCAVGGPIIRYATASANPGKMPPHLENTVMVSDFESGTGTTSVWAVPVNPTSGAITEQPTPVFTMARSGRPNLYNSVDFQQGPDGPLYMIDWGAGTYSYYPPRAKLGIVRIRYTGTCQDPGWSTTQASPKLFHASEISWLGIRSGRIFLADEGNGLLQRGRHTIHILNLQGKILNTFSGVGLKEYPMPILPAGQVYLLRAETPLGIAQRIFSPL